MEAGVPKLIMVGVIVVLMTFLLQRGWHVATAQVVEHKPVRCDRPD